MTWAATAVDHEHKFERVPRCVHLQRRSRSEPVVTFVYGPQKLQTSGNHNITYAFTCMSRTNSCRPGRPSVASRMLKRHPVLRPGVLHLHLHLSVRATAPCNLLIQNHFVPNGDESGMARNRHARWTPGARVSRCSIVHRRLPSPANVLPFFCAFLSRWKA